MLKNLHLTEFFRVMGLMKKRIWIYSILLLISCSALASYEIINSFVNKNLLNYAINKHYDLLWQTIFFGLAAFLTTNVLLDPIARYIIRRSIRKTIYEIRLMLVEHIEKLPIGYFDWTHSGEIMSKINNDLAKVSAVYGDNIHRVLLTTMQGIGAIVTMFILEWRLAMIAISIGLLAVFINLLFAKPMRMLSDNIQQHLGVATQYFIDIFSGMHIIKMFNIREIVLKKFTSENNLIASESLKRTTTTAQMNSMNFLLAFFNLIGIICIGAFMLSTRSLDVGTMIAVMTLQSSSNNLFLRLGGFFTGLQTSLAGAARIFELIDEKEEQAIASNQGKVDNESVVELNSLSFAYEKGKSVIKNLNLSVKKGQMIALVGPSGGGKSTIFKLLMSFYQPLKGNIIINGKPQSTYTLAELRQTISYVSQEAYLFNATIAENIRYGQILATDEQIVQAAKAAYVHNFIATMPKGYNTIVGDRGSFLSGGQKQRISIARALLKDAPILLLDEATSALDSESEQIVYQALKNLIKDRTVIAIAHRLSTITEADVILVIENGSVSEMGTHQELFLKKGTYHSLIV